MRLKRNWIGPALFIISLVVYYITLQPDLGFIDCGELAASATTLGVCHPTGYPLWTILAHFWTLLPLPGSAIFQLNLFAAFVTALSVWIMFLATVDLLDYLSSIKSAKVQPKSQGKQKNSDAKPAQQQVTADVAGNSPGLVNTIVAAASALAYAFAQTVWAQGNSIEVYSLQALMIASVLFVYLRAVRGQNKSLFLLASFLLGLSFSNHMTTVLLVPAMAFLYFFPAGGRGDFSVNRWKALLPMFVAFVAGLSLYLYLPLRSAMEPAVNWGWVHRSLSKFLYHVQGKQYQVWMFTGREAFNANLVKFLSIAPYQLGFIGLVPMFWGAARVYRKDKSIFWFLILLIVGCLAYSLNYAIHDIETYFLTAIVSMCLLTAIGLWAIFEARPKFVWTAFAVAVISLFLNFQTNDLSEDVVVPEYTRIMTEKLPTNSVIISSQWDFFCSAFIYKQNVEKYRTDIVLVEQELLRRTWYLEQFRLWYPELAAKCSSEINAYLADVELFESGKPFDANKLQAKYEAMINAFIDESKASGNSVYITSDVFEREPNVGKSYEKVPDGLAFRLEKEKKHWPVSVPDYTDEKIINSLKKYHGRLYDATRQLLANSYINSGYYAMRTIQAATDSSFAASQLATAESVFKSALKIDPQNPNATKALQAISSSRQAR